MSLANTTHFFVVAHPDDIELFMFNELVAAIQNNHRIILVVVTAGDDGKGYQNGAVDAYWALRNLGHQKAIQYLIDRLKGAAPEKIIDKFGHEVLQVNNVYMYNLMLPDQLNKMGNTILSSFDAGEFDFVYSINQKIKYAKNDLNQLLVDIFNAHKDIFGKTFLHITDENMDVKNDHVDHQIVSKWAIKAFANINGKSDAIYRYQTYLNYQAPINLDYPITFLHAAIWAIYNNYILQGYPELSGRRQLPYIGKQYLR